jgi:hypothetical protein
LFRKVILDIFERNELKVLKSSERKMPSEFISHRISFPRPFALVIDDMGWIQGSSMGEKTPRGPYRNGVKRVFGLDDYRHVTAIAQKAGIRVQGLFVLSELDRANVLTAYPTTTYQRSGWDNSANINDAQLEMVNYVVSQSAHLEFGFHGIGHEHWPADGVQKRAEWYNLEDDSPWPEEVMRAHVKAARSILDQYGLSPSAGHSFPETFVPGAYSFYWNPHGPFSLGKLMRETGVKYANTNFTVIPELDPPAELNGGGFDHGLHVLGRLNYGNLWHELRSLPKVPIDMQPTDIVETHWINWLASDDFLQPEVSAQWVDYYRQVARLPERYPAKNTAQLHAQWLYKKYTVISMLSENEIAIDNTRMPSEVYENGIAGNLVLRILLRNGDHISEATIDGQPATVTLEQDGYGYLYLSVLQQKKYRLQYSIGASFPSFGVVADGTYNVLGLTNNDKQARVLITIYGKQEVTIYCKRPSRVNSGEKGLLVAQVSYDEPAGKLTVLLEATDYQGITGEVLITWDD